MDNFSRFINLIQKTGDKLVITDTAGNAAYVIMTLKDYEKMILGHSDIKDLTEEELLAKINRDIALWRSAQETENLADFSQKVKENPTTSAPETPTMAEEDKYYVEPVENL